MAKEVESPQYWQFSPGTRVVCPYSKRQGTITEFPNDHGRVILRWDDTPKSPSSAHVSHIEIATRQGA